MSYARKQDKMTRLDWIGYGCKYLGWGMIAFMVAPMFTVLPTI